LSEAISDALTGRSAIDRAAGIRYARQFTTTRVAEFYLAEYQAMLTPPASALASALEDAG